MDSKDIHLNDWTRILFGEVPATFYIEAIIRVTILFCLLVIAMRLLGRRMAAQLSRTEMLAMSSLAAAIGVPIMAPDRGILPSFIIAIIVVGIGKVLARRMFNNQAFEKKAAGNISVLVQDAVLQLSTMKKINLSEQRVFAQLRSQNIKNLGQVKRLLFEANGSFTLIKCEKPQPGLSIIPETDLEMRATQKEANEIICLKCGKKKEDTNDNRCCSNCKSKNLGRASI